MSTSQRYTVYVVSHDSVSGLGSVLVQEDASVENLSLAILDHSNLKRLVKDDSITLFKVFLRHFVYRYLC